MNVKQIDKNMNDNSKSKDEISWYSNANDDYSVHGLYWFNLNNSFSRLREDITVSTGVDNLKYHPSGAYLSFKSNTTSISLKVELSNNAYMSHMSACGQCGLDLYFKHNDEFLFLATTKINQANYEITIIKDLPKEEREYRLYLPLYIKLIKLEIGIDSSATITKVNDFKKKTIVCYGTSISQGGCATRPGMNYSSILGRILKDYEVYNLGFSGSAKIEEEIALEIIKIKNINYLILEVEANTGYSLLKERFEKFLDITSNALKDTKIFVISHFPLNTSLIKKDVKRNLKKCLDYQKQICAKYENVEFIDGRKPLKDLNYEETVDGVHLTDLGFYYLANFFAKKIKKNAN